MRKWESVNRGTERNAGCNAALWIRTADTNLTMSFPLASNSHRSQKVSTEIRANQTWRGKTRELREGTREWTINRAIRMHSHERLGMFCVYEERKFESTTSNSILILKQANYVEIWNWTLQGKGQFFQISPNSSCPIHAKCLRNKMEYIIVSEEMRVTV